MKNLSPTSHGVKTIAHSRRFIAIIIIALLAAAGILWFAKQTILTNIQPNTAMANKNGQQPKDLSAPQVRAETIVSDRNHIWDIGFLPSGQLLFTERKGSISAVKDGKVIELGLLSDIYNRGEGGLMGLAIDPKFDQNQYIYLCFNSNKNGRPDVRVARFTLDKAATALSNRVDIITGIPSNDSGRHSGCRMRFGPDDQLWIGTGDAAHAANPQDPISLGGKILRVDRNGKGSNGNLGGTFDNRIFSYGHRNTQGLAFRPGVNAGQMPGYSIEHGSNRDDEINPLTKGNFGWNPKPTYDENVPMTDLQAYPDAVSAIWQSGTPTQAPSGGSFISGVAWKGWDGALAIAMLKAKHLKIALFNNGGQIAAEKQLFKGEFGRMRSVVQGPDGALYISTDNSGNEDKIIKVVPL